MPGDRGGAGGDEAGVRLSVGERPQRLGHGSRVVADGHGAVVEDRPGLQQRPARLRRGRYGLDGHPVGQAPGLRP